VVPDEKPDTWLSDPALASVWHERAKTTVYVLVTDVSCAVHRIERVTVPEHAVGLALWPPDGYDTVAPIPGHVPVRVTAPPAAGRVTVE
jgi:hypothetical protein